MKKVFEKTTYWAGVLVLGIIVGITIKIVGAWVEPNQMPPGGNIAAPLNTGNIGQAKQGGLTLNIGGATYGLIVDKGLVGIGTTAPGEKLEVNGNIKLSGDASGNPLYKITNLIAPTGSSDAATKGYVDATAGSGGGGNGEYTNKIPDTTPPNAYTEVCFKNGTMKYDKHDSGASTQGGDCLPGDSGFIIDKNLRSSGNEVEWDEARLECVKNGMRLPETFEDLTVCRNKDLGISIDKIEFSSNYLSSLGNSWEGSNGMLNHSGPTVESVTPGCFSGIHFVADQQSTRFATKHAFRCAR